MLACMRYLPPCFRADSGPSHGSVTMERRGIRLTRFGLGRVQPLPLITRPAGHVVTAWSRVQPAGPADGRSKTIAGRSVDISRSSYTAGRSETVEAPTPLVEAPSLPVEAPAPKHRRHQCYNAGRREGEGERERERESGERESRRPVQERQRERKREGEREREREGERN